MRSYRLNCKLFNNINNTIKKPDICQDNGKVAIYVSLTRNYSLDFCRCIYNISVRPSYFYKNMEFESSITLLPSFLLFSTLSAKKVTNLVRGKCYTRKRASFLLGSLTKP